MADIKKYPQFPYTPPADPTKDYQVANKQYVDAVRTSVGDVYSSIGGMVGGATTVELLSVYESLTGSIGWLSQSVDTLWTTVTNAWTSLNATHVSLTQHIASASAHITNAAQIFLGAPTDGSWTDGINSWVSTGLVVDALDDLNELCSYLAPDDASALAGAMTAANISGSLYTGYLAAGLGEKYKSGSGAGTVVAYIIADDVFQLTIPSPATMYNKADEGRTVMWQATSSTAFASIIDVTNSVFFEEAHRASTQDTTPWGAGNINVTSCEWYNSFPKWQIGKAVISVTTAILTTGYNKLAMTREGSFTTQSTNAWECFYDDTAASAVGANMTCTISLCASVSNRLSGVGYYGKDTYFQCNVNSISNICKNVYMTDILQLYPYNGSEVSAWFTTVTAAYNSTGVSGLSSPPSYNEIAAYSVTASVVVASAKTGSNIRVKAVTNHPFKASASANSGSSSIMINSYPQSAANTVATSLNEYFCSEWYRVNASITSSLSNITYTTTGGTSPATWDNEAALVGVDARYSLGLQCFNRTLIYPVTNFGNYLPATVDYSAASGDRYYYRYFTVGDAKQNFTFSITGSTLTFVAAGAALNANEGTLEMCAPATTLDGTPVTVFKDCYTNYTVDSAIGCYVSGTKSVSTTNWLCTLGTKSTSTSGYVILIRLKVKANWTGNISYIGVSAS